MDHSSAFVAAEPAADLQPAELSLADFIRDFRDGLLAAVARDNPPVFGAGALPLTDLDALKRPPFAAQRRVIEAIVALLVGAGEHAAVINGEMGTGKTLMGIAAAAALDARGYRRCLCIVPPHLVYKWRREILATVPGARVTVLNGPDCIGKLLRLRDAGEPDEGPAFYILGRVRMRMGFHWRPAVAVRRVHVRRHTVTGDPSSPTFVVTERYASCPVCGEIVMAGADGADRSPVAIDAIDDSHRLACGSCGSPLWQLVRRHAAGTPADLVRAALLRLPTIGPRTAERLIAGCGAETIGRALTDNIFDLTNMLDADGQFIFSERRAERLEKALGTTEFAFGQGNYQPSEFIKRHLADGFFGCCLVDEGHEYKAASSAQALAMAVLAGKARKVILLTGTLMGGYADDLFHLLWRLLPQRMMEDGYRYTARRSLASAAHRFMEHHGVLKEIHREHIGSDYRTARGRSASTRTSRGPGFGPEGVARYVLPFTAFLKLRDIDPDALPPFTEHLTPLSLTADQAPVYETLARELTQMMRQALARGDTSLLGVVLNVLLRWPDTCFRGEAVRHPGGGQPLAAVPPIDGEPLPKEDAIIRLALAEQARGRRVLLYTVYTGRHDLTGRYAGQLRRAGLKTAVLKADVATDQREDWIMAKVDAGIDVLICNPELVKTGLDLYDFPTIVFAQTGYSVFTLQQASRRSWRIGQTQPVAVHYLAYAATAQIGCLELMAKKIAAAQSTSGDVPESGLNALNQDGDTIETALARQLVT